MHFKSIATSLAKSANGKKSVRSTKGGICGVRTQRRSHHHHTGRPVAVWVRACNVWLPQGPSYSMNVVVRIGKQRLYKPRDCHQILTSSRTVRQRATTAKNDDLRFCQPCEKCEWWGPRERGARKLFERIVPTKRHAETDTIDHAGRWLDQRVAILADQPLCSDELDDQLSSLLCRLIR